MSMPIYSHPMSAIGNATPAARAKSASTGARLVSTEGVELPLKATSLSCEFGGGIARSVLKQRFENTGSTPLAVSYLVPLPSDGAVSGYSFTLQAVTTRGVVAPRAEAREQYEQALMDGRSAALLEQTRSSVFSQDIGNIPAGESIEIEVIIDHPLTWIGGGWEARFPTVVAPRYQNTEQSSSRFDVPIALAPAPQHASEIEHQPKDIPAGNDCRLCILDALSGPASSSSHTLEQQTEAGAVAKTWLRVSAARLDRDLVVRWPVAQAEPGARLETARPNAEHPHANTQYALLSVVPPLKAQVSVPRDLIVLIDTSGSMSGEPLAQSVRLVSALIASLDERDRLELIEFSYQPQRWQQHPLAATPIHKQQALNWLQALKAGGGTEMRTGIEEALRSLREGAQRQVILVSDGLIGFEQQILETLTQRLPQSCRLHCVGVGHGVNRSLTEPASRAGRGVELIVAPGEDVEPACARLLARVAQPQIVNLRFSGSALLSQPARPLDVYAGSPALVALQLKTQGGSLIIHGDTDHGGYLKQLEVSGAQPGAGAARVLSLCAREQVSERELELAAVDFRAADQRQSLEREIEALGVDFQIATRLTSWVALSNDVLVDPAEPTHHQAQPHELAAGLSAEGLGLRPAAMQDSGFGGMNVNRTSRARSRTALGASAGLAAPPPPPPTPASYGAPPPAGFGPPPAPAKLGAPPPAQAPPARTAPPQPAPARPSAPEAPKRRKLLERVIELFSAPKSEVSSETDSAAPEEVSAAAGNALPLSGTVRIQNEQWVVVEIDIHQDLIWHLPSAVWFDLADGTRLRVAVDLTRSTRDGAISAGQVLRLVCAASSAEAVTSGQGAEPGHTSKPQRLWISHGLAPLEPAAVEAAARFIVDLG